MRAVDIPVMPSTTDAARPYSYPQRTQSTRSGPLKADRASDAGEHLADCDADTSKPDGFVVQLMSDHAPTHIVGRFGYAGFGQLRTGHVANRDEVGTTDNRRGDLVRPVFANIFDLGSISGRPKVYSHSILPKGSNMPIIARIVYKEVRVSLGPVKAGDPCLTRCTTSLPSFRAFSRSPNYDLFRACYALYS